MFKPPEIIVSPEDQDLINDYGWCKDTSGYCRRGIRKDNKNKHKYLHVEILERKCGLRPEGLIADHEDRNKNNNQRNNLRWITRSESVKNRTLQKLKTIRTTAPHRWFRFPVKI